MLGHRSLLINPPPANGIAFTRQGRCQEREDVLGTTKPPYSLALLATLLRNRGHDVKLVDQTAERLSTNGLIERLIREKFEPSMVLFCSSIPTLASDTAEAARLKRAFGVPLICFGPHATGAPRESMERAPEVDAMIVGEPEESVLELAALESIEEADRVAALTVRRGDWILPHRVRGSYSAFFSMPYPAWDLLPLRCYRLPLLNSRYLIVETSRGCPYSCDFCVAPLHQGHTFRERDAVAIADEIEEGKRRFGITDFYLWGDTVTLNTKSFERFCDEMIGRNLNVRWFGNGRADNLTSLDFAKKLRRSGCWMLSLGIEAESDQMRRDMSKGLEREPIREAIKNLRTTGIKSFAFFIFGHPGDTVESMERTARYACEIDPDFANFYPAVPYPGTELYQRCVREGLLANNDWSKMEYSYYILQGNGLNETAVMGAVSRATRRFFLRPRWFARHWLDIVRLVLSSGRLVWRAGVRLARTRRTADTGAAPGVTPTAG